MDELDSSDQLLYPGVDYNFVQVVFLLNGQELRPHIKLDGSDFEIYGYQKFRRDRHHPFKRLELIPNGGRIVVLVGESFEEAETVLPGPTYAIGNLNVKAAFGAVGDGVADDTAAVVAAYNQLGTAGGTIFFPPGIYRFNLLITKPNVTIIGAGRGASGGTHVYHGGAIGGTTFRPADLTKPVIQIGDGTVKVNAITLRDFTVLGDSSADANMVFTAGTPTSDGIVEIGAHYVNIEDVDVFFMGGDGIRVTSAGTQPAFWTNLIGVNVAGCGLVGMHFVYGPVWCTTINIIGGSCWSLGAGANTYAIRSEGVGIISTGFWAETQSNGHLAYLDYDASRTIPPLWAGSGTTNLDSGSNTDTLMEINTLGSSIPARRITTLFINGLSIDGQVKWTADSVLVPRSTFGKLGNTIILGQFGFNANLLDSRDEPATPTRMMQGGGGVGSETIDLTGAGLRVPGSAGKGIAWANGGQIWRSANGMLRYLASGTPPNDGVGISVTPHRQLQAYSASMTPDVSLGEWIYIAVTNATPFTINAPSTGGNPLSNMTDQRITITISNQTAGALGAVTWALAAFRLAGGAWVQPVAGFQRSIDFRFDGTVWIEVSRNAADVQN